MEAVKSKIIVELPPKVGGYDTESLWAIALGNDNYEIANIPFFAYNLNLGDIVRCNGNLHGLPKVAEVINRSGKETLRLAINPKASQPFVEQVLQIMLQTGATVEKGASGFFATSFKIWPDLMKATEQIRKVDTQKLVGMETGYRKGAPFCDPE